MSNKSIKHEIFHITNQWKKKDFKISKSEPVPDIEFTINSNRRAINIQLERHFSSQNLEPVSLPHRKAHKKTPIQHITFNISPEQSQANSLRNRPNKTDIHKPSGAKRATITDNSHSDKPRMHNSPSSPRKKGQPRISPRLIPGNKKPVPELCQRSVRKIEAPLKAYEILPSLLPAALSPPRATFNITFGRKAGAPRGVIQCRLLGAARGFYELV